MPKQKRTNFYVAYGSNLNIRQMRFRCPDAKLYKTGVLPNYTLEFRGHSGCAYATITPKEGSSVPVAVWRISQRDERSLDSYEGYPSHYFKEQVEVELNGERMEAMAYRMNLQARFGIPAPSYYRTVREGYRNCGLDTDILNDAVNRSADAYRKELLQEQAMLEDFCPAHEEPEMFEEPDENDPFYVWNGHGM